MAAVDVINGEKILIQIGDGADPEVFAHPCLINTERGIQFSSSVTSEVVPDCATPGDPAWTSTEVDGLSATISGAGMLDVASVEEFFDWYTSGLNKNVKVKIDKVGGRTFTGAFKLTEFGLTGTRKSKATCSVTLVSDGAVADTANT
jgi:predicted secreted protein